MKKKKIEFLFPELCIIFAESYNLEYLCKCSDNIEIVETRVAEEPAFIKGGIDMVYIGCMTENGQEKAAAALLKYKKEIEKAIEAGQMFLFTGNAIELLGTHILCVGEPDETGADKKIECLGLFNTYAERRINDERHNSQFVGKFDDGGEGIVMVGHKSQFSFSYGDTDAEPMLVLEKGVGMNKNTMCEGLRRNNLYATYSLGPVLVQNPYFTQYLLGKLGLGKELCFGKEAIESYEYRLSELRRTL